MYRWWEHLAAHNSPHNFTHHVATPHRILWEMPGKPSSMGALVCHITILGLTGQNNMGHLTSWRFVNVYHHFIHYTTHNSWTCLEIPIYTYIIINHIIYIYITIKWLMNGIFPLPPLCGLYILFQFPLYQRKHPSWWPEFLPAPTTPTNAMQRLWGPRGGDMQKCVPGCPGRMSLPPEHDRCPQIVS